MHECEVHNSGDLSPLEMVVTGYSLHLEKSVHKRLCSLSCQYFSDIFAYPGLGALIANKTGYQFSQEGEELRKMLDIPPIADCTLSQTNTGFNKKR